MASRAEGPVMASRPDGQAALSRPEGLAAESRSDGPFAAPYREERAAAPCPEATATASRRQATATVSRPEGPAPDHDPVRAAHPTGGYATSATPTGGANGTAAPAAAAAPAGPAMDGAVAPTRPGAATVPAASGAGAAPVAAAGSCAGPATEGAVAPTGPGAVAPPTAPVGPAAAHAPGGPGAAGDRSAAGAPGDPAGPSVGAGPPGRLGAVAAPPATAKLSVLAESGASERVPERSASSDGSAGQGRAGEGPSAERPSAEGSAKGLPDVDVAPLTEAVKPAVREGTAGQVLMDKAPSAERPAGSHPDGGDAAALCDPGATMLLGAVGEVLPGPAGGTRRGTGRGKGGRHAGVPAGRRPAPSAEPRLAERPGAVLPGWVGVLAGLLAVAVCVVVVWWSGAVPESAGRALGLPFHPWRGLAIGPSVLLAVGVLLALFAFGGLVRGRVGHAWVLTLFGDYRGTVRRTGLVWVSPLLLRRRIDVRLRHWRSEPLPAVDANGTALRVVVLVVWRIRDTVRAALTVADHEQYLREQVEAALARVLSQLPADAFQGGTPTLRDAESVGEALTRMLATECAPVGVEIFSAQPTRIDYAPEIAAAMRRRRIAAIDAEHRDAVLTSVVDAVDDMVHRLTTRGLVDLDDYERKALVKDLTVAFYTGHAPPAEGA
ncbi:SPFH domain-containing protein [Streptomyces sp. TRM49041]|uniref:SPFH domain-containing protein n=1 Tax=Streptomyces sp. TRM49041 TaxID=2603216 RepID=UPI0021CCF1BE|nr:SPFH domain-containing protein [Streptomyces sp. TRM49041]